MARKPILLPCPACSKNISSDAHSCPHCGQPLTDHWEQEGRQQQAKTKKRTEMWGGGIFVLLCILVGIGQLSQPKTVAEFLAANCSTEGSKNAIVWAETLGRSRLKSPKTAEFSEAVTRWTGDCNVSVYGKVDAQNSFGAMVRSTYTAEMVYRPEADTWEMVKFTMN